MMTDETTEVQRPKQLTMRECCNILQIHKSTFKRRVKEGAYGPGVSSGPQSKPGDVRRFFTYEDIHLPEGWLPPEPEPEVEALIDTLAPIVHRAEPEVQAPKDFAADYRAGDATDSCGNRVDGRNERYSETVSLLGPIDEGHRQPVLETQNHMRAELRAAQDAFAADGVKRPTHPDGDYRTRSGQTLAPGMTRELYEASLAQWNRSHHGPERLSMSEQREAQERSKKLIHAAFPKPQETP